LVESKVKARTLPCLLSTSINEVKAVPPTVHSSTGAARLPTWVEEKKLATPIMQQHTRASIKPYFKEKNPG